MMASGCCGCPARVAGHTTKYYVCDKCGEPCDVIRESLGVTCAKDCLHFQGCAQAIECVTCGRFEMELK